MSHASTAPLVWVDLEMTGLDPEVCAIVQMAMVITDWDLKPLAKPLELTIWQPDSVLERMVPYVRKMHERSGLLSQIRASDICVADAEKKMLKVLTSHVPMGVGRLSGNTIGQDRRFLRREMPTFDGYLHYRQIDVSSIKELAGFWYGKSYSKSGGTTEGKQHTALFDIEQSIAELAYYREHVFKPRDGKDA